MTIPSGGFWNLCLTWKYWQCVPVYMQMEEGKLCFKIALGEDETGLKNTESNINSIQDYAHASLLKFALENGFKQIRRPDRHVHNGEYRTFAVIDMENWLGNPSELLNKEKVMADLGALLNFYDKFIDHLNATSPSGRSLSLISLQYCLQTD